MEMGSLHNEADAALMGGHSSDAGALPSIVEDIDSSSHGAKAVGEGCGFDVSEAEAENECPAGEISATLTQGKLVAIVGAPSMGKSTILRLLAGQIFPSDQPSQSPSPPPPQPEPSRRPAQLPRQQHYQPVPTTEQRGGGSLDRSPPNGSDGETFEDDLPAGVSPSAQTPREPPQSSSSSGSSSNSSISSGGGGGRAVRTAESLFDEIDTSKDGSLSREELVSAMPAYFQITLEKANKIWDQLDADGNGSLSRAEFEALNDILGLGDSGMSMNDLFTLLDTEKDGVLTVDEIMDKGPECFGVSAEKLRELCKQIDDDDDALYDRRDFTKLGNLLEEHRKKETQKRRGGP
jgi:Ca2+-binding EF-hand superfamily protein